MAKKRKKVSQPTRVFSSKKYIKERARNFPIVKCYYTTNWENEGLCQIMVIRQQPSGNFMFGFFLIDPWCLGVKNVIYRVNYDQETLDDFIGNIIGAVGSELLECEYVYAHNFIYGALEYAEELGFYPDSDFRIAKYILEEDNDEIELIEFEFGKDGKPFFCCGPYDDNKRILNTLERSVGAGNFRFIAEISPDF